MGLIKTTDTPKNINGSNTDKRIAPPPPGVPTNQSEVRAATAQPKKTNGGNVRGQVAMHIYKAKMMSPEYAGRYVTHAEFVEAVRKDTIDDLEWFEKVGLL